MMMNGKKYKIVQGFEIHTLEVIRNSHGHHAYVLYT